MYEPPKTTEASSIPATRPRRRYGLLMFLLVLSALAALGWLGAQKFLQEQERLKAAATQLGDQEKIKSQRLSAEIAGLRARLDAHDRTLAEVSQAQGGGRARLQLLMVEHLLLTANERLQLARDVPAAQLALELADARLADLNEPRLFKVREAIASERGALGRMPRTDSSGAALSLSAIIDGAATLPLAARVPERFVPAQEETQADLPTTGGGWLGQAWTQIKRALGAMFSVRRARGPAPRLLAPEQEVQVHQILLLRLEAVRVALLRGQQPALRETAASATGWLQQRFHGEDSGVQAALAELQRVAALPLDAPRPDISGSLTLLRAQLATRAVEPE